MNKPPIFGRRHAAVSFIATIIITLCWTLVTLAATTDSTFGVGDRVQTVSQTAVFANPPFAGRFVSNQPSRALGSIVDGPVRSAEVWWWEVRFDDGSEGWIAERQLVNTTGKTAATTLSELSHPTASPTAAPFLKLNVPNGATVNSSRILLLGTVTNDVYAPSLIAFSLNGAPVTLDRRGNFLLPVELRTGPNTLTFQSTTPNPRQQPNQITSFLDGSMIYGSDTTRATAIRGFQGGKLAISGDNLPPLNTVGLANANDAHLFPDNELFLAGDVRANENVELSAIHTLFVREHNQIATAIAAANHSLNDEQIFQMTRRIVAAEIQVITYNEFLPALLGPNALRPYFGYDPDVNPGISTEFSTGAFRIGHTLVNDDVEFLDNDGNSVRDQLDLDEAFFNPAPLKEVGPDPILKYLASDNAREVDTQIVGALRNFLFGPPGAGGFDLASLNIQRGRDHGLSDYNTVRAAYGLPRVTSFTQITSDPMLQAKLFTLYQNVDSIDLWVGGLAEDHVSGSSVGPTFQRIIANQFERVRDGDRFWYERIFFGPQLQALRQTRLSAIIKRNTSITKLQDNVFFFDSATTLASLTTQPGSLPPALIGAFNTRFTPAWLNGNGNNQFHPGWGAAGFDLMRYSAAAYADGLASPAGTVRPSPRLISNTVSDQTTGTSNARNLSDWIYGWGQFIDHDLDLTTSGNTAFDVAVPLGDPSFDPASTGTELIYFSRSIYDAATGTSTPNVQQQMITINYQPTRPHPRHR
jgi:hypothetical protein